VEEGRKGGGWVQAVECNVGAPVEMEELPSQADKCGNGGIKRGMKYRSSNESRGLWSTYPCRGVLKEEELTAEGYRRESI